ncbi:MAG TPA: complex I NDUFA9 subunit family protein [Magnetospirillaceae bacterium]|jgi:NADH dehydrogenase
MARLVTVFGGSGFLGRHLVRRLAAEGDRVRIAVRDPEGAHFLKPAGNVGQIVAVPANIRHEGSVRAAVAGADAVVNLVGRISPGGRNKLDAVHVQGARAVAAAAKAAGVKSLVHISALGADAESRSPYLRTKGAGEAAVHEAFPGAVILRPALVFGPEDRFFNRFAALTGVGPALPVIGHANFQPVYVGDVASAILAGINNPALAGKTFSLGGPRTYSMQQILEMVLAYTGRDRALIPVALFLVQIQAFFLQFVPGKPLTPDQLHLLTSDNVVPEGAAGFAALGITPAAAEAIVPTYLARFRNPFSPPNHSSPTQQST